MGRKLQSVPQGEVSGEWRSAKMGSAAAFVKRQMMSLGKWIQRTKFAAMFAYLLRAA